MISEPVKTLEPPSLPLTKSRWPNPLEWTTPWSRWVLSSNWEYTQSSISSVVITVSHPLHLDSDDMCDHRLPHLLHDLWYPSAGLLLLALMIKWYRFLQTGCPPQPTTRHWLQYTDLEDLVTSSSTISRARTTDEISGPSSTRSPMRNKICHVNKEGNSEGGKVTRAWRDKNALMLSLKGTAGETESSADGKERMS